MTALVCVTVTVNVAATPPALLEMDPLHVPAVGDTDATAMANATAPPGTAAVAEPTAAIVATVPGELLAPIVHVNAGVKVGARPLCDTESVCVVGEPPITSATAFEVMLSAGGAVGVIVGVAVGAAVGAGAGVGVTVAPGVAVAVAVERSSAKFAGTFAKRENGAPFDANVKVVPLSVAGPAHKMFHPVTGS
jgi:hypothetical protein